MIIEMLVNEKLEHRCSSCLPHAIKKFKWFRQTARRFGDQSRLQWIIPWANGTSRAENRFVNGALRRTADGRGRMREDYGPDCSDSHEREAAFHQYRPKSNQSTMYIGALVGQTLGRASGRDRTRPRDFTKTCCRIVRGLISKKVEPLLLLVAPFHSRSIKISIKD